MLSLPYIYSCALFQVVVKALYLHSTLSLLSFTLTRLMVQSFFHELPPVFPFFCFFTHFQPTSNCLSTAFPHSKHCTHTPMSSKNLLIDYFTASVTHVLSPFCPKYLKHSTYVLFTASSPLRNMYNSRPPSIPFSQGQDYFHCTL